MDNPSTTYYLGVLGICSGDRAMTRNEFIDKWNSYNYDTVDMDSPEGRERWAEEMQKDLENFYVEEKP